jgi:hypothetical protein
MVNWAIRHKIKHFLETLHYQRILDFGCGDQKSKKYINNSNKDYGMDVKSEHGSDKKQIFDYEFDTKNNTIN